jgi:hypothetical protein
MHPCRPERTHGEIVFVIQNLHLQRVGVGFAPHTAGRDRYRADSPVARALQEITPYSKPHLMFGSVTSRKVRQREAPGTGAVGKFTRSRIITSICKTITDPLFAWSFHAFILWGWHIPSLFESALHNEAIHTLQHICFLFSALLFWWAVLGGVQRSHARLGHAVYFHYHGSYRRSRCVDDICTHCLVSVVYQYNFRTGSRPWRISNLADLSCGYPQA